MPGTGRQKSRSREARTPGPGGQFRLRKWLTKAQGLTEGHAAGQSQEQGPAQTPLLWGGPSCPTQWLPPTEHRGLMMSVTRFDADLEAL